MRRHLYSPHEDMKIIKYIVRNRLYTKTRGIAIWQDLSEDLERSWQSLRERFLKFIYPNLSQYSLKRKVVVKFRSKSGKNCSKLKLPRSSYRAKEDQTIINFIHGQNKIYPVKGNKVWRILEASHLVPRRTWQSMRNRYLNVLSKSAGSLRKNSKGQNPNISGIKVEKDASGDSDCVLLEAATSSCVSPTQKSPVVSKRTDKVDIVATEESSDDSADESASEEDSESSSINDRPKKRSMKRAVVDSTDTEELSDDSADESARDPHYTKTRDPGLASEDPFDLQSRSDHENRGACSSAESARIPSPSDNRDEPSISRRRRPSSPSDAETVHHEALSPQLPTLDSEDSVASTSASSARIPSPRDNRESYDSPDILATCVPLSVRLLPLSINWSNTTVTNEEPKLQAETAHRQTPDILIGRSGLDSEETQSDTDIHIKSTGTCNVHSANIQQPPMRTAHSIESPMTAELRLLLDFSTASNALCGQMEKLLDKKSSGLDGRMTVILQRTDLDKSTAPNKLTCSFREASLIAQKSSPQQKKDTGIDDSCLKNSVFEKGSATEPDGSPNAIQETQRDLADRGENLTSNIAEGTRDSAEMATRAIPSRSHPFSAQEHVSVRDSALNVTHSHENRTADGIQGAQQNLSNRCARPKLAPTPASLVFHGDGESPRAATKRDGSQLRSDVQAPAKGSTPKSDRKPDLSNNFNPPRKANDSLLVEASLLGETSATPLSGPLLNIEEAASQNSFQPPGRTTGLTIERSNSLSVEDSCLKSSAHSLDDASVLRSSQECDADSSEDIPELSFCLRLSLLPEFSSQPDEA